MVSIASPGPQGPLLVYEIDNCQPNAIDFKVEFTPRDHGLCNFNAPVGRQYMEIPARYEQRRRAITLTLTVIP